LRRARAPAQRAAAAAARSRGL
ncbi:MAG: LSU ribosomal protein L13p (L13Ae), partial [uncultured Solirubrobacteraceae bacterium]